MVLHHQRRRLQAQLDADQESPVSARLECFADGYPQALDARVQARNGRDPVRDPGARVDRHDAMGLVATPRRRRRGQRSGTDAHADEPMGARGFDARASPPSRPRRGVRSQSRASSQGRREPSAGSCHGTTWRASGSPTVERGLEALPRALERRLGVTVGGAGGGNRGLHCGYRCPCRCDRTAHGALDGAPASAADRDDGASPCSARRCCSTPAISSCWSRCAGSSEATERIQRRRLRRARRGA